MKDQKMYKPKYFKTRRCYSVLFLIIISASFIGSMFFSTLLIPSQTTMKVTSSGTSAEDSILWRINQGLPGRGATMQPRMVNLTATGVPRIIVGMDKGIAAISLDGFLEMSYSTFSEVFDFIYIDDISGDGLKDLVLITFDQETYNVIAVASNNGSELWKYKPTIEGFDNDNYQRIDYITHTWDLVRINDINDDSVSDLVISSWYRIIALDGKNGHSIKINTQLFSNDVWKMEVIEDIDGNGYETIIAGSQDGVLKAFDSKTFTLHWTYKVDETYYTIQNYLTGFYKKEFKNSVNDIRNIGDRDNDNWDDVLITSDDGMLRVISGCYGTVIDEVRCCEIGISNNPIDPHMFSSGYYDSSQRFFRNSGVNLYKISDGNEDNNRLLSVGYNLGFANTGEFEALLFSFNKGSSTIFNISHTLNWSSSEFYDYSRPEILTNSEGETSLYFFGEERFPSTLYLKKYNLEPIPFSHSEDLYKHSFKETSDSNKRCHILNIGDVNGNGVDDIFCIGADGRYLCLDGQTEDLLWIQGNNHKEKIIKEISDINKDGVNDYLISQISEFTPTWDDGQSSNNDETITNKLSVIDVTTGKSIWDFKFPTPQYYNGIRDLKEVGDIDGDGHAELAGWIIPSKIPNELLSKIGTIAGNDYDKDISANVYRAMLYEYIRFIVINGSTGNICWNASLIDFPHKFYRQYSYNGSYLDPLKTQYNGKYFYNRHDNQLPISWTDGSDIQWNSAWNASTLQDPREISIEAGQTNAIIDTLFQRENSYYNISSVFDTTFHKILMNLTIPINFRDESSLGVMPYHLSKFERLSALKIQTSLFANKSSKFYNFSYEIYDHSQDKWVLCNWNTSANYWDNSIFPDLKGGYDSSNRDSFKGFNISESLETDSMWIISRGTKDADYFVEFDYENQTRLSQFLTKTNELMIRINITNKYEAFNLSIDSFGIGAFFWGLSDGIQYDTTYLWNYLEQEFTEENILDLTIQDFEVINATGDRYLDIIAVIGKEDEWSSMISVFDIYHRNISTYWDIDNTILPNRNIQILPIDNNKSSQWLLTGIYDVAGEDRCIHRLINHSLLQQGKTHFENYTKNIYFDYEWEIIPDFDEKSGDPIIYNEYPTKVTYSDNRETGIIVGEYEYISPNYERPKLINLTIVDVKNASVISKIPVLRLEERLLGFYEREEMDFEYHPALPYQLMPSYIDFDGDGYLDHIALYMHFVDADTFDDHDYPYSFIYYELKILSGNNDGSEVLFSKHLGEIPYYYFEQSNQLRIPLDFIYDEEGDEPPEILLGIQSRTHECDYSTIESYDIDRYGVDQLLWEWKLQDGECSETQKEFFTEIKNIGDVNGDNLQDFFLRREDYVVSGSYRSVPINIIEVVDVFNRRLLYRLEGSLSSVLSVMDINVDNKRELLAWNGNTLLCINSQYNIEISNIKHQQQISSNFYLQFTSELQYDYLEVFVDHHKYSTRDDGNVFLSLGGGRKDIEIFMYDESGYVTSLYSITVYVNRDYTQYIITIILAGILVIGGYLFHKQTKKKEIIKNEKVKDINLENEHTSPSPESRLDYEILTKNLTKIYKDGDESVEAVSEINLRIEPGIHGYLGPNGAGKTTTLNMLIGAISITEGEAFIRNKLAGSTEAKRLIGFLPQDPILYDDMTGREYLYYIGRLSGLTSSHSKARTYELLEDFDLFDVRDRKIGNYSGGMKQKIAIASALIHEPKLLILDEPTANLDPIGRADVINKIKELSSHMSVFVSSHILSEVEQMCEKVTMINKGKIILSDSIAHIKQQYLSNVFILNTNDNEAIVEYLKGKNFIESITLNKKDNNIYIISDHANELKKSVSSLVFSNDLTLHRFDQPEMSLQDIFMKIMSSEEIQNE